MSIGAIDPAQRRLAERLVLQALRRFHREQPLAVDLRMDALVARVRRRAELRGPRGHRGGEPLELEEAELRRVIGEMVDDGRLARSGRRIRLAEAGPTIGPEMAARVETLLTGLRAFGAEPPRIEGIAARLGIPPALLEQLRAAGQLRHIGPGIDYPAEVWSTLRARVESMTGPLSVGRVRDELRTSRRHAEAILAAVGARPARPGTDANRSP